MKNKLEDLHKMMKKTYFSCQLKNLDIGNAREKYLFHKVVVQTWSEWTCARIMVVNNKWLHRLHAQLGLTPNNPVDCSPPASSVHGIFPGKNSGMGFLLLHFLLQGIFLTQGLNMSLLCLLHWQWDSLPVHQGKQVICIWICITF